MQKRHWNLSLFNLEKIVCYLVIISGFFGSLLIMFNMGPFQIFPFRVFLALLWVMICMRVLLAGKIHVPQSKVRLYLAFLLFWMIYAVFSLIWSISFVDAVKNIVFLFIGISLVFFICYYYRSKEELTALYLLYVGFFILLLTIGIMEHWTGYHLPTSRYYNSAKVLIPTSVFYNENDFATFLTLYMPFAVGIFYYGHKKLWKLISIVSICCSCYLIIIIGARSSMLALCLEFAVLLLLLTNLRQKVHLILLMIAGFAVLNAVYPSLITGAYSAAVEQINSLVMQYELQMGSVHTRQNLIRNGFLFLISTKGFGVGAGNIEYWIAHYGQYNTLGITDMHNWWMEIMTAYGVWVFIGYVLFFIGILYNLIKLRVRNRYSLMFSDALILSLCGFVIACVGPSSLVNMNVQWFLFGIALAYINNEYNFRRKMKLKDQEFLIRAAAELRKENNR